MLRSGIENIEIEITHHMVHLWKNLKNISFFLFRSFKNTFFHLKFERMEAGRDDTRCKSRRKHYGSSWPTTTTTTQHERTWIWCVEKWVSSEKKGRISGRILYFFSIGNVDDGIFNSLTYALLLDWNKKWNNNDVDDYELLMDQIMFYSLPVTSHIAQTNKIIMKERVGEYRQLVVSLWIFCFWLFMLFLLFLSCFTWNSRLRPVN